MLLFLKAFVIDVSVSGVVEWKVATNIGNVCNFLWCQKVPRLLLETGFFYAFRRWKKKSAWVKKKKKQKEQGKNIMENRHWINIKVLLIKNIFQFHPKVFCHNMVTGQILTYFKLLKKYTNNGFAEMLLKTVTIIIDCC